MRAVFAAFERKMADEGIHPLAIAAFERHYAELTRGETGMLSRHDITPVDNLPTLDDTALFCEDGLETLARTAVIKLNGGLGTSMGLNKAKSLLRVKDGLSFLDIIARQMLDFRTRNGLGIPLVLMNSFATEEDSRTALARYRALDARLPASFLQSKVPKVLAADMTPAVAPGQPELEWCPPGHGDLYTAIVTSGLLHSLTAQGFDFLFVSNADNLGAVLDAGIAGYIAARGIPFLMEVAERSSADVKGGHLARTANGRLALREIAQCPEDERDDFQDIGRYRYFNTNTMWIHVPSLAALLAANDGVLPLRLIRNRKHLNPRDETSPMVYQLETAMGSAIALFEDAAALVVPRSRFAPVKTCDDLLVVWSDAYVLTDTSRIVPHPERQGVAPTVSLDERHYRFVDQLEEHFPHGAPSLKRCSMFHVTGNVLFGKDIVAAGDVRIRALDGAQHSIPDGTRLEGDITLTKA